MLANNIKRLTIGVLGTTLCWISGYESLAQQPPSTRYQPVGYQLGDEPIRQQASPPSVHIPPSDTRALPTNLGIPSSKVGNQQQTSNRHMFSDNGPVMQTSFQDPAISKQEPAVPEILQRARPVATSNPPAMLPRPPASTNQTHGQGSPGTSPAQFSSQLSQLRQAPSVDQKLDNRLTQMKRDLAEFQQKAAERSQAAKSELKATSDAVAGKVNEIVPGRQAKSTEFSSSIPGAVPGAVKGSSQKDSSNSIAPSQAAPPSKNVVPSFGTAAKNEPVVGTEHASQPKARNESINDFLRSPNQLLSKPTSDDKTAEYNSQPTQISDTRVHPASMQDQVARQTADLNTTDTPKFEQTRSASAIRLSAPSIAVESFGPQSIGINKPAVYKVVATNETNRAAERVVVSIDLPIWVEIDKINMTAGEQQKSENKQFSRLMWKIDQIPGNGSQTITITAIPRKAEAFDLGIEWTIAPRAGTASIQVTQPKLEMSIVGPEEVPFGETAPYEVTVRNAGNGVAENVVVMLSEALNGERGNLGDIPAGSSKTFSVKLFARTPGELELGVSAMADNQAESTASRKLVIRRANLGITITGPTLRYAGTTGEYIIKLTNTGDATAEDVVAAMGLPSGVKFIGGIEAFKLIDGGLRWQVGSLEPGQTREYKANCQLDASGDVQLEVGTQGKGALQSSHACVTKVQTIADLVMQVNDPPGPLTTGDEITYEILVENRGTKTAKGVDIFMILSEGMEPKSGSGLEYRIPRDGALQFATIPQLDPGQKVTLKVNAVAFKPGTHVFRAHLVCEEADAREIKEGTSRFFGDEVANPIGNTANEDSNFNNSDFKKNLK